MKKSASRKKITLTAVVYVTAVLGIMLLVNACNKSRQASSVEVCYGGPTQAPSAAQPLQQDVLQSKVVSVMDMAPNADGTSVSVAFRELQEVFEVTDGAAIAALNAAHAANSPVRISFDPWKGLVSKVSAVLPGELSDFAARKIMRSPGSSISIDLAQANPDKINNVPDMAVINTSMPGLENVVPDMATAQLMFDYLANQCCNVPGPYGVDYCLTFQYCEDGCYARAHKMCYVINNRFHYATHKIFSFAYPLGLYRLSVKAEKWGGCCINWWYHVAPLVSIKTPSGIKAYVFDPAMFDQPVLLATWLHAQENPACALPGHLPKVTSYNIQPTSSYGPNDTASFVTDPLYTDTDATLVSYHSLRTCP